jgi:hypothetical protein
MSAPTEKKLHDMLVALDRSLVEVTRTAEAARTGVRQRALSPYYDYRAALDEYEALVLVIRNMIGVEPGPMAEQAKQIMLEREREVLALTIRSSLDIFFSLSAIPNLSLGVRECFTQELRSLKTAERRVSAEVHRGSLSPDLEHDLMTAREILSEILEKAPVMLDFDEQKKKKKPTPRPADS